MSPTAEDGSAHDRWSQRTRRAVLRSTAASTAAIGVAGCLGGEPDPTDDEDHSECPDGETDAVVSFSFSYDESAGDLIVKAQSVVTSPSGSDVYVHGDGLHNQGTWTDLGGGTDDNGMINAGHAVTVGADPDYHAILEEGQMLGCESYTIQEHSRSD